MKAMLLRAFTKPQTRIFHIVQDFFAVLTIISIVALVLETVPELGGYATIFILIEWVAVLLFTVEYLCRLYVSKPTHKYPFSFFGVIDLVAIVPTFFGLGNFTFLKSARALRIIRLLRMMRLAKVSRGGFVDEDAMSALSLSVLIYVVTLLFALLVTGTAMYLVEPEAAAFVSIPAGMWWSLKVFMSGIPVAEPTTQLGELLFVLTRFVGLLMLGVLVGVVGNVFRAVLMSRGK